METKERVVEVVCLSISMAISEYSVQQVLQKYPRANQISLEISNESKQS